jgi:hypothetical protein
MFSESHDISMNLYLEHGCQFRTFEVGRRCRQVLEMEAGLSKYIVLNTGLPSR